MGETLSEIGFLWDRIHNAGQFTPRDTIVLHLYGRYCNSSTFAGEVDLFEALDDVKKNFQVDDNRILVRGFSMGGISEFITAPISRRSLRPPGLPKPKISLGTRVAT